MEKWFYSALGKHKNPNKISKIIKTGRNSVFTTAHDSCAHIMSPDFLSKNCRMYFNSLEPTFYNLVQEEIAFLDEVAMMEF